MKIKKIRAGMPVMALAFAILLAGCELVKWFPGIYTVWTGTTTSEEFQDKYGEMKDGSYRKFDLTSSEFSQISPSLQDENKHVWVEEQIIDWLMVRGVTYSDSQEVVSWFSANPHVFCALRDRATVYIIVK